MKKLMIAIAGALAIGASAFAEVQEQDWFDANIPTYTTWPATFEPDGGKWVPNATAEVSLIGEAGAKKLDISTDEEPLVFATSLTNEFSDTVTKMTFTSDITFEPFTDTTLPDAPANAKVGIILVKDSDPALTEDTYNYYVLGTNETSNGVNVWNKTDLTGALNTPVAVTITVWSTPQDENGSNVEYMFDDETSREVVGANLGDGKFGGVSFSGDGVVGSLAATFEKTYAAVTFTIADVEHATFKVDGAEQVEGNTYTATKGADVTVTYTADPGYFFKGGSKTVSVNAKAAQDIEVTTDTERELGEAKIFVVGLEDYEYYYKLTDAFNAVKYNQEITLCADVEFKPATMYTIPTSLTLDLDGHDLTGNGGKTFEVINTNTLTITAADSKVTGVRINVGKAGNNNGSLAIVGGDWIIDGDTIVHVNGECDDCDVDIDSASLSSIGDNSVQFCGAGEYEVTCSTLAGETAVYIKAGVLTIADTEIFSTATEPTPYVYNPNGATATGDAIVIDNCNYPCGPANVTIEYTQDISAYSEDVALLAVYGSGAMGTVRVNEGTMYELDIPAPKGYSWKDGEDGYLYLEKDVVMVDLTISAENATVDGISAGKVAVGTTLSFTVAAGTGYTVTSVTANDEELTPDKGVYSYKVEEEEDVAIVVSTKIILQESWVSMTYSEFEFDNGDRTDAIATSVSVYDGSKWYVLDTDYEVVVNGGEEAVDVGEYSVVITGIGDYAGVVNKTVTITAREVSESELQITFEDVEDDIVEWESGMTLPYVTVKYSGAFLMELDEDTDYTGVWSPATITEPAAGTTNTYTYTVTVKGNYHSSQSFTKEFKVFKAAPPYEPVVPGDSKKSTAETEEAAKEEVQISADANTKADLATAGVTEATYVGYFTKTVTGVPGDYTVTVEFSAETTNDVQKVVDAEVKSIDMKTSATTVGVSLAAKDVKPGLYYGIAVSTAVDGVKGVDPAVWTMATSEGVSVSAEKPTGAGQAFYMLKCSATDTNKKN